MSTRNLAAAFIAMLAGVCVFALLLVSGVVLYERLFGGSAPLLVGMALLGGAIGAYMGWLLALILFSALRGDDGDQVSTL